MNFNLEIMLYKTEEKGFLFKKKKIQKYFSIRFINYFRNMS